MLRPQRHSAFLGMALVALAVLALVSLAVGLIIATNKGGEADFRERCLAAHPGAHVDVSYASRSYPTYYCLGPNGELWSVQ